MVAQWISPYRHTVAGPWCETHWVVFAVEVLGQMTWELLWVLADWKKKKSDVNLFCSLISKSCFWKMSLWNFVAEQIHHFEIEVCMQFQMMHWCTCLYYAVACRGRTGWQWWWEIQVCCARRWPQLQPAALWCSWWGEEKGMLFNVRLHVLSNGNKILQLLPVNPKGRLGMSDVTLLSGISGLSFDSPFLSPLLFCSA